MTDRGTSEWMGPVPAADGCDCQVCRPDPAYDEDERRTIDTVLQHGWQVSLVSDDVRCEHTDHDHVAHGDEGHDADGSPSFAYTVGLGHRCGHPELLISGLDPEVMHRALNDLTRRVMQGRRLAPGDVLEDVLAGVPVVVEQVTDDALRETVTWSGWFHRRRPEALAIVWPSVAGLFAWQPGAPSVLNERQPPEWRAPIRHTGGVDVDPSWDFPVPPERMAFSCVHVVEDGEAILWVARELEETRGEDWSIHCGADGHDTSEMRMVHLAHLVRSAPSLRALSSLGLDEEAFRISTDSEWTIEPLA
ncbi:DUF4262 domain-containing protein [Knoellia sp. CPCC 206453]|uniref:DUF4262 domain-containing protein n=1 Tax=Knoellia pratensis TaxID=3404796 RepID=UPI00360CA9C8